MTRVFLRNPDIPSFISSKFASLGRAVGILGEHAGTRACTPIRAKGRCAAPRDRPPRDILSPRSISLRGGVLRALLEYQPNWRNGAWALGGRSCGAVTCVRRSVRGTGTRISHVGSRRNSRPGC